MRVLVERGGIEALHYRDWYDLLASRGYSVAGKNGLAVFLTQLSRSPAVRKGTQAGVDELDRSAPLRVSRELERLQSELRDLAGRTPGTTDLSEVRARREQLTSAISQNEKALKGHSASLLASKSPRWKPPRSARSAQSTRRRARVAALSADD